MTISRVAKCVRGVVSPVLANLFLHRAGLQNSRPAPPAPDRATCMTGEHMMIMTACKCVAANWRAGLQWPRRGKICPLYQEGGSRDVR